MDNDVIIVDDVDDQAGLSSTAASSIINGDYGSTSGRTRPLRTAAEHAIATNFRRHSGSTPPTDTRATRSSTLRQRPQPKLKLKLSEKAAAQAPGMSFLGPYDRELDSDDDDLTFEEQFILRMPPGEDCEKLRKMVSAREVGNDVWFKFKGGLVGWALRNEKYLLIVSVRFAESYVPHRKLDVFLEVGRPSVYHRVAQNC